MGREREILKGISEGSLREMCGEYGLSTKGSSEELIDRLAPDFLRLTPKGESEPKIPKE